MSQDNFHRIARSENFLKAAEQNHSFALAPSELAAIREHRQTRKIRKLPTAKKVIGMSDDKTDAGFSYRAGESFFDKLVAGVEVVCGRGARFDPETTQTMVAAIA